MPRWLADNLDTILWSAGLSVVLLVVSLLIVGIVLVKLPPDYFNRASRRRAARSPLAVRIGKNILGWLLILAGLAMLVLPGQGLLTLLIGVMLADFPGKFRLERWIISRKKILTSANWLRAKFDKPPLHVMAHRAPGDLGAAAKGSPAPARSPR